MKAGMIKKNRLPKIKQTQDLKNLGFFVVSFKWSGRINGDAADCKSVASGTPGSIPGHSTTED